MKKKKRASNCVIDPNSNRIRNANIHQYVDVFGW